MNKTLQKLARQKSLFQFSTVSFTPAKLPDLKYGYNELEPVLSANLLSFHHGKHHQAYVNNLNATYEQILNAKDDYNKVASLQKALQFNLGGHLNHSLYWENLAPISKGGGNLFKIFCYLKNLGQLPKNDSPLGQQIIKKWKSFDNFIAEFTKRAVPIQGSGWGWLGYETANKSLRLFETPNQDIPQHAGMVPLLTIDVWEHAYYLDYQNLRLKYLTEVWKIVNWADVERRYNDATK